MKEERVELRVSHQEKMQFEMETLERSSEIVNKNHALLLSNRDRNAFLSALEVSPEPNKHLKKAFSEYRKTKR